MPGPFMGVENLALSATSVTPDDDTVLPTTKSLYVGVSGNVAVQLQQDTDSVIFIGISGFLPVCAIKVLDTGTTATDILALY